MNSLSTPAQYLLRVDDLCPTMASEPWRQVVALIGEFHLRPILAVVPQNRDPELMREAPDPAFWEQMRSLEIAGATIALHGYQHLCRSAARGLLGLAAHSEFAGVAEQTQREWIDEGLRILRGHGLNPRVWVAPRHGFDRSTLRVLRSKGISVLSDGLARVPFWRRGLTWLPQQLWSPVEKRKGLWTICIHPNTMREAEFVALRAFLRGHADRFTSVDRVLAEFHPEGLCLSERMYATLAHWRIRARKVAGSIARLLANSRKDLPSDPARFQG